ncbi:MAG: hypothetical protein IRY85_17420 [Micromonosporaceae bacterium]|nr:hypothetical protein [Micromonosporaceae bacterium]
MTVGTTPRRRVAREAAVVAALALGLAVVMTWPALRNPTATLPHDLVDSALVGWVVSWGAHALWHDPGRLFDANAFYPEPLSYAFSDTLLGYWPLALLGHGVAAATLAVNLIYVLVSALASVGGYAFARQLGAGPPGAAVAGLATAYAPWRLSQAGHLHVLSTGGILLALAMLARGHGYSIRHGLRPERGHAGWIVAGWLVAAWQITIGFGIGLVFAYVLAGLCLVAVALWWRRGRRPVRRAVWLADLGGGAVFAAVSLFMALPYLRVVAAHPYARRGVAEIGYYSPPLHAFLVAPEESWLWHDDALGLRAAVPLPTEMSLLPGYTLLALAAVGLVVSVWPRRWRIGLGLGVLVSMVLATGTRTFAGGRYTYLLLYHLPGWDGLRTPGRLVVWTTILLAVLAAGAVTALGARLSRFSRTVAGRRLDLGRLVGVLAAVLVVVEGLSVMPHLGVPEPPAALTAEHAEVVRPPLLVLPSDPTLDPLVMLWTTDGFPPVVNGLSGFTPATQAEIRSQTERFPDRASVDLLRRYGVRTVVVLRDRVAGTPWANAPDAPVDGLGLTRTEIGEAVVYSLS